MNAIKINNFLDEGTLTDINGFIDNTIPEDSKKSAGENIRHKKESSVYGGNQATQLWTPELLTKLCENNPITWTYLIPMGCQFLSYSVGQHYDTHFDQSYVEVPNENGMDGFSLMRSDLSYTIALNDNYEGGDLIINNETFRLKTNEIVIYPNGQPHSVTPVTKGERRVVVGWFHSPVADSTERELLAQLMSLTNKFTKLSSESPDCKETNATATSIQYIYEVLQRKFITS